MSQIIFLHGALGAEDQFERFKQDLSPEHQIYTFDFAGHGKSAPNPQFSIEFFADQLAEFCEGMDHYHIFGYSMGGYVALFAAALKRINPLSIITLGTKFDWDPEFAEKETQLLSVQTLQEFAPVYYESLVKMHGDKMELVLEGTKRLMENLGKNPLLSQEKLSEISCPVFICRGDRDKMITEAESMKLTSLINGADYCVFENTSHQIDRVDVHYCAKKLIELIK